MASLPLHIDYLNGFTATIDVAENGRLAVRMTHDARQWIASCATINDAVTMAGRIMLEQSAALPPTA